VIFFTEQISFWFPYCDFRFTESPFFDMLFQLYKRYWGKANDPEVMSQLFQEHPDGAKTLTLPEDIPLFPESFRRIPCHRALILPQYDILIKKIMDLRTKELRTGVVITGHPGIGRNIKCPVRGSRLADVGKNLGKTYFHFYLLIKRTLEAKPTVIRYRNGRLVGLTDDGFHIHSEDYPEGNSNWKYPRGTWALADPVNTKVGTSG
jgi:hypothetical protein